MRVGKHVTYTLTLFPVICAKVNKLVDINYENISRSISFLNYVLQEKEKKGKLKKAAYPALYSIKQDKQVVVYGAAQKLE